MDNNALSWEVSSPDVTMMQRELLEEINGRKQPKRSLGVGNDYKNSNGRNLKELKNISMKHTWYKLCFLSHDYMA